MTPAEARVMNQIASNMLNQSLRAEQLQEELNVANARIAELEAQLAGEEAKPPETAGENGAGENVPRRAVPRHPRPRR